MNWPRFSALNDATLKRFRFQAIFIAIVWGVVAGIRTTGPDQSAGAVALTTFLWIVCAGFLVTSVLAFTEVRRRNE